eukprot:11884_1
MAEQAQQEEEKNVDVQKVQMVELDKTLIGKSFGPTPKNYNLKIKSNKEIEVTSPEWSGAKQFSIECFNGWAFKAKDYGGGDGSIFIYDNGGVDVNGKETNQVALFERNAKGYDCWWSNSDKRENVKPNGSFFGKIFICEIVAQYFQKITVLSEMVISVDNIGEPHLYYWTGASSYQIKCLNPLSFMVININTVIIGEELGKSLFMFKNEFGEIGLHQRDRKGKDSLWSARK